MGNQIFYPALENLGERRKGDPVALEIPVDAGEVSDGYHTFNELYTHRYLLFCGMSKLAPRQSAIEIITCWKSRRSFYFEVQRKDVKVVNPTFNKERGSNDR